MGSPPGMGAQVGASAGHVVVNNVMGRLMVADRRTPGASLSTSSANHHICVPPIGPVRRDGLGSLVVSPCFDLTVYEMACFQRSEPLRQPLPSSTSSRRRYFLPSYRSSHDVAASLLPVVAAPVRPGCRDLQSSSPLPDSVLEQLTDDPPCLGIKKQRVVKVVRDGCVGGDRRTPGRTNTGGEYAYLAASHTLLPSASADPRVPNIVMDWAALS